MNFLTNDIDCVLVTVFDEETDTKRVGYLADDLQMALLAQEKFLESWEKLKYMSMK